MGMNDSVRTEAKSRILVIGKVYRNQDGSRTLFGWVMDGNRSTAPGVEITADGPVFFGGYTVDELEAIAAATDNE